MEDGRARRNNSPDENGPFEQLLPSAPAQNSLPRSSASSNIWTTGHGNVKAGLPEHLSASSFAASSHQTPLDYDVSTQLLGMNAILEEKSTSKIPEKPSKLRSRLSPWLWETCAILFSFACMVAIAAILISTNNKPLSHWRLPISPNALMSTFNTLAKSAMLLVLAECISQMKWI